MKRFLPALLLLAACSKPIDRVNEFNGHEFGDSVANYAFLMDLPKDHPSVIVRESVTHRNGLRYTVAGIREQVRGFPVEIQSFIFDQSGELVCVEYNLGHVSFAEVEHMLGSLYSKPTRRDEQATVWAGNRRKAGIMHRNGGVLIWVAVGNH